MSSGSRTDVVQTWPPQACAAALASLPQMTVRRLGALLRHLEPDEALEVVAGRRRPAGLVAKVVADRQLAAAWQQAATPERIEQVWERCINLGVTVLVHGSPDYPALLLDDPLPPAVLFAQGDPSLLNGRRVGIVGTRNATASGRASASAIAADLAGAGVHVVSGLARGVDGAAHRGVLSNLTPLDNALVGRPIAIVGSGHDVIYPREHGDLWRAVATHGLLLSESPPGTPPEAFRFPLRNRIIAALSEIVVVVESRATGGSLITAVEAAERGVPVMAVPGGINNRAAAGANHLLRDGAGVVVDASDVLLALSLDHRRSGSAAVDQRTRPRRDDIDVYRRVADEPCTLEALALATGRGLAAVAMSLARLQHQGWIAEAEGWFETVGSPLR